MNIKEKQVSIPKGEEAPQRKELTVAAVKEMLKVDLVTCLLMLQGIHDDPDTLDSLAVTLHGKYMNQRHKEELEKQGKLDV